MLSSIVSLVKRTINEGGSTAEGQAPKPFKEGRASDEEEALNLRSQTRPLYGSANPLVTPV